MYHTVRALYLQITGVIRSTTFSAADINTVREDLDTGSKGRRVYLCTYLLTTVGFQMVLGVRRLILGCQASANKITSPPAVASGAKNHATLRKKKKNQ